MNEGRKKEIAKYRRQIDRIQIPCNDEELLEVAYLSGRIVRLTQRLKYLEKIKLENIVNKNET